MITSDQQDELVNKAYVPEHLTEYVAAISKAEPFLRDGFLSYFNQGRLIFIGYPLDGPVDERRIGDAIANARQEFSPSLLSITSPILPASILQESRSVSGLDHYYRLDLSVLQINKKLRSLLKRAGRDLEVCQARSMNREHQGLIDEFLRKTDLEKEARTIFKRLPDYARTRSACILEARRRDGSLAALDIADLSASDYGFYLFNFCSRRYYVPGAADLLLSAISERMRQEGKRYLNLGLGINPGIRFFKTKWGAQEFLPHRSCVIEEAGEDILGSLLDKMF